MINTIELYQIYQQHPQVITDSRKIQRGCLFFALKGPRFDGNQYALEAIRQGAAYAIVDDLGLKDKVQCLLVEDVLSALQDLARHHRRQFDIPLIAITGSNGKTTTKELLSLVLGRTYRVHYTQGNLNNHIGVPLTLLAMPENTEVAIIEMGANHLGEINFLCEIAEPTHGLITNIGKAHLEGFGGIEGVKKAKSELYRYLTKKHGLAFVNLDEAWLEELSKEVAHRVYYHRSDQPDPNKRPYEVKSLATNPFIRLAFLDEKDQLQEVSSQLIGAYNFNNIMTAICLGKYFKVPGKQIQEAIASYQAKNNRSQLLVQGDHTYILDAYNANPSSMCLALDNLHQLKAARKVAILGDMLELGAYSEAEHKAIIRYAQQYDFDDLLLVGSAFAVASINQPGLKHFDDSTQLRDWLSQQNMKPSTFLIKGSRGIQLEKILAVDIEH